MVMRHLALVSTAALALSACASTTETYIGRTATEQLLMARASDKAVEGLSLPLPTAASIFVDESYFQGEGSRYAISAIRAALSDAGYRLARNKDESDAVFEIRPGALSLEQMRRVFGLPEMRIPINETLNVVSLPELSVYSNRDRVGVAEFSGFLYEAKTGAPLGAVLPMIGEYRIRSHKLLMIVSWGQQQAQPGRRDPGSSWTEF
ncbi:MAG: hypothetical protein KJ728_02190 [Alphaproteobacteria bacterium]|jgi:hypothetical protein|uniref:FlgO domain-containing protein n=2 Tax=Brevundimonas mediterranea TaxID=74329 RepID=A0AB37E6L7_9CAUL|nr:hypothetical protein BBAL3_1229 [Brevundimonas sp. BAL3]KDP92975.1 hypothetical protein ER13_05190 [Brevundimonas sp. EAKA]MBA4332570.1 hypothetical protein [Brevundimonas sp.]MBU1271997.1 hypothetical protein [Alphaproteobacteria bacterium]OGN48543.1 MAG: hypothetical protein A3E24_00380 [Caulobacterales bacterium RIFCSPHIGHO2_12_FULL_68_13]OGN50797.1 MAG: hypothetical protein A2795_12005 [Caulobacterales bacterium RIFCSPHIGHO2_01_FULL_67_30]OGN66532.1 MAG: hypothetical protein A3K57_1109